MTAISEIALDALLFKHKIVESVNHHADLPHTPFEKIQRDLINKQLLIDLNLHFVQNANTI